MTKIGPPVLEVNNDQYPTAVLQRRIVEVEAAGGQRCLALEEDVSTTRLEAVGSTGRATVASISGQEKYSALDAVLEATRFEELLERRLAESGKRRADFRIAIKPNFMFAYNKEDRSTYTDPELVEHLVQCLTG